MTGASTADPGWRGRCAAGNGPVGAEASTGSRSTAAEAIAAGRAQAAFAWDENVPDLLAVSCRKPGCDKLVARKRGAGRTKWFCSPACQKEFHRRRAALDEVIDALADVHLEGGHSQRELRDLESELSRVIGIRSAYVGPADWVVTGTDDRAATTQDLVPALRKRRVEVKRHKEPCLVCDGTGDYRRFREPITQSLPGVLKARARMLQAERALVELNRLKNGLPTRADSPGVPPVLNFFGNEHFDVVCAQIQAFASGLADRLAQSEKDQVF